MHLTTLFETGTVVASLLKYTLTGIRNSVLTVNVTTVGMGFLFSIT